MTSITRTPTGWLYRGADALQRVREQMKKGYTIKARTVRGVTEIELRVKK